MLPERLAQLPTHGVTIDFETHLIQIGLLAPPLVCGSIAQSTGPEPRDIGADILDKEGALAAFRALVEDPDRIIIGANIAFDMLVGAVEWARLGVDLMPAIFQAYEDGRVYDVLIAEQLHAIAEGTLGKDPRTGGDLRDPISGDTTNRYSLAISVDLTLDRRDAKANDEYRERYAELEFVPIEDWPVPARTYPIDDARNTHEDALAQAGFFPKRADHHWIDRPDDGRTVCDRCDVELTMGGPTESCRVVARHRNLHAMADQVYTAWALHLGAAWGFNVDQDAVTAVEKEAIEKRAALAGPLQKLGFLKWKRKRNEDTGEMENLLGKDTATVARATAVAFGASGHCDVCDGTAKVPSPANPKTKINCQACRSTGLDLSTAPTLSCTEPSSRFPNGQVQCGRDQLYESGDDDLRELAEYGEDAKTIQTYVPYLRRARIQCTGPDGTVYYKSRPLTLKPNVLLETDRTSYADTIQQFPRTGNLRATITARPGYHLCSVDYNQGELITHSQSCIWILGWSNLADAILGGAEPHKALGATMLGAAYEEYEEWFGNKDHPRYKQAKDARQASKPANFGYPGGMGSAKLVLQQRKQGPDTACPNGPVIIDAKKGTRGYKGLRFCILMDGAERCGVEKVTEWGNAGYERTIAPTCRQCLECADRLREFWHQQWQEAKPYFKFASSCVEQGQLVTQEMLDRWPWLASVFQAGEYTAPGEVIQHYSGIVRGGVEFTNASNGWFQSLLAVAAKMALRQAQRECCDVTYRIPTDPELGGTIIRGADGENVWVPSKYAGKRSPLYGSRVVAFQHDECLAELLQNMAHDAAMRLSEIMVRMLQIVCPDMAPAVKAPPALMSVWLKGAEPRFARGGSKPADANDRLIPWDQKEAA